MTAESRTDYIYFAGMALGALTLVSSIARAQVPPEDPAARATAPPEEPPPEADGADATLRDTSALPPDRVVQVANAKPPAPDDDALPPESPSRGERLLDSLMPEFHGFVSQGFIKTTENNYLANSEQGSFEMTEVGLNLTKQLGDRLRVGMQLFMRDLGPIGNYKPQFDWAYIDYRFFDWLGIRAGRTKIPFGLYNEVNDIDAARVPILLPQSVYPTSNRDFLLAQTGGEVYGHIPLRPIGALQYRAYGGTIFIDETDSINNIEVPFVVGGRVMWETPLDGLRLGGTVQAVRLEFDNQIDPATLASLKEAGILTPDASEVIHFEFPVTMWIASVEYSAHDVLLAAEYSRWEASLTSSQPALAAPLSTVNERFYVMASMRAAPWFSPGVYYSYNAPDVADRSGVDGEQHDVAVTARYDVNDHWLVKLEGHYMHGTADLNPALNGGTPTAELAPDWGVFLVKTTAYF